MESPVSVIVHPSRFPRRTRALFLESLRTRRMNHQFHYDKEKQAQQWLALHERYSPARTDDDCLATYAKAFGEISQDLEAGQIDLVSLGCGGGQKDLSLLRSMASARGELRYIPTDVSLSLALTAHARVTEALQITSMPMLLDLPHAPDLARMLPNTARRIIAFFGMLPNFEPAEALRPISESLRADDLLILSANLAPGPNYGAGVEKILPLYDNALTRQWLSTVLVDAGLELSPGDIEFKIKAVGHFLRVEANYRFRKKQRIRIDGEEFQFARGDNFRLFFSYRHTPALLRDLLRKYKIQVVAEWITASQDEGVFLCRKVTSGKPGANPPARESRRRSASGPPKR